MNSLKQQSQSCRREQVTASVVVFDGDCLPGGRACVRTKHGTGNGVCWHRLQLVPDELANQAPLALQRPANHFFFSQKRQVYCTVPLPNGHHVDVPQGATGIHLCLRGEVCSFLCPFQTLVFLVLSAQ